MRPPTTSVRPPEDPSAHAAPSLRLPSRRVVAKGVAWTLPAVSVAASAPAFAASFPPGLQGWTYWTRNCPGGSSMTLELDGAGPDGQVYPTTQYGLYVFNTTASTVLTSASITFTYSPGCSGTMSWSALPGSGSNWSTPTQVSPNTYRTSYSGTWTYAPAVGTNPSYSVTTQTPAFTTTISCTCQAQTLTIVRSVTVDGTPISFTRAISL